MGGGAGAGAGGGGGGGGGRRQLALATASKKPAMIFQGVPHTASGTSSAAMRHGARPSRSPMYGLVTQEVTESCRPKKEALTPARTPLAVSIALPCA